MEERRGDHVFVVRMWAESAGRGVMRGRIDHPASGERRYFSNFGDICDFLTAASTFPPRDATGDDGAELGDASASGPYGSGTHDESRNI